MIKQAAVIRMLFTTMIGAGITSLALLPGCDSVQKVTEYVNAAQNIVGEWKLDELMGQSANLLGTGGKTPGFTVSENGQLSGFAGVNRFTSKLDMDKLLQGDFSLAPAAATKMAGSPEAMNLEDRFLNALTDATGFDLSDGQLTLKKGAETLMKLVKG